MDILLRFTVVEPWESVYSLAIRGTLSLEAALLVWDLVGLAESGFDLGKAA
jgi:hypothetical protein